LSQGYQQELPTQNYQASRADSSIIKKFYWKVSNNRNNIFPSNPKVPGHSPQNFMIIGHIGTLWKFIQLSPIIKWQGHNLKTTQALTFKFLSELEYT
jgi:hypothetical protein